MSLTLNVPSTICVGGQTLRGEVQLRFPQVVEDQLEEVHVKLRGAIYTRISRQIGNQRIVRRQTVPLVSKNVSLWKKSTSYPPAGSEILRIPFDFPTDPFSPPSCQYDAFSRHGRIGYYIEAVGTRSGVLSRNRRARVAISFVPQDIEGEGLASRLQANEPPVPLTSFVVKKQIRRGFFGEYANARIEFSLPDLSMLPLFTPIPYTLHIVTISKPMKKDEADKAPNKPIFPCPPSRPTDVQFRIRRHLWLKAHMFTATGAEDVTPLGGMEVATITSTKPVEVEVRAKEWIPSCEEGKSAGTWLQDVTFRSVFVLTCPPTFKAETMHLSYTLDLKVDFPGIGNGISAELPVHVCSGLSAAPPSYTAGSDQPPPPALDLPPSYWGSADSWDEDDGNEKDMK